MDEKLHSGQSSPKNEDSENSKLGKKMRKLLLAKVLRETAKEAIEMKHENLNLKKKRAKISYLSKELKSSRFNLES